MLTNAFRVIVNNLFKENFYGEKKKKSNWYFDKFFYFP